MNSALLDSGFTTLQFYHFLPLSDCFQLASVFPRVLPTRRVSKAEVRLIEGDFHVSEDGAPARQFPLETPKFDEILHCDHLVMNTVRRIPQTAFKPTVTFETRGFNHMLKRFMNRDLEEVVINSFPLENTDLFNVSFEHFLEQLGPRTRSLRVPIKRFRDWKLFASLLTAWASEMREKVDGALEHLKLDFSFASFADLTDFLVHNIAGMKMPNFRFPVTLRCHAEDAPSDPNEINNLLTRHYKLVTCGNDSTPALTVFSSKNSAPIVYEEQHSKNGNRKRRQCSRLLENAPKKQKSE